MSDHRRFSLPAGPFEGRSLIREDCVSLRRSKKMVQSAKIMIKRRDLNGEFRSAEKDAAGTA